LKIDDQISIEEVYQTHNTLLLPLEPMLDFTRQSDHFVIVRPSGIDSVDPLEVAYLHPSDTGQFHYSHEEMLACLINGNYRSYPIAVTQNVEE
jgi:hypothetical protein